ncbi:MAG: response regulator [Methylococcaceae bacterium]|nr:response regulator [Prolixibacteraceae bacterium]
MKELTDLNILLAEDDLINQKIASFTFSRMGVKIDIASNGKEAVEMYHRKGYDVILMDLQMPVMDGLEAARQIRTVEKEKQTNGHVYIIALTANMIADKKDECMQAGMDNMLEKPLQVNELREIIAKSFQ